MNQNDMRKLNRADLLRIVVRQQEKIEEMEKEIASLHSRLEQKQLICQEAGSIAQAALQLNEIFEKAQAAADQYLVSVQARADQFYTEGEKDEGFQT